MATKQQATVESATVARIGDLAGLLERLKGLAQDGTGNALLWSRTLLVVDKAAAAVKRQVTALADAAASTG